MSNEKPKMEQCPKYNKCGAMMCPLYDRWRDTKTKKSDTKICFYLREASKQRAEERFTGRKDEVIFRIALEQMPLMKKHCSELNKRLEKSSLTGSRISAARAIRNR